MNNLARLTIVIVTYKTDNTILRNCLNSIDKNVQIKIIENSHKIENQTFLIDKKDNLSTHYTGKNLGYGAGNNYGFSLVNTDYVIVANPDIIFHKTFFENVKKYIDSDLNFTIIGSTYNQDKSYSSSGLFKENDKKIYKNDIKSFSGSLFDTLTKVDWVTGCMMLINLKKFNTRKIFDESFFLYFEEFDLCKGIELRNENVFRAKDLLIDHLGYKGSFGSDPINQLESEKLREWHWMWSTFYFYRKNYGYLFAIKKTIGKLLRSFFKAIFYTIILNKRMKSKYISRFNGLLNSIAGKKSSYRVGGKYQ
jgi:N-acetylglucosaminyl-diphospho-decaprenol L-rhamnosyltransferase|tara:strand:- start:36 stop:959 length:924 start_codon:yes stop_codon:yes gene_type:complete